MCNLSEEISKAENALKLYTLDGDVKSVLPYGSGHINTTFKVVTAFNAEYILQKINDKLFDVPKLMDNILKVTEYAKVHSKTVTLPTLVLSDEGKSYVKTEDGFYRVYDFVKNSVSFQVASSEELCYLTAATFAEFSRILKDFPAETLYEIIPKFHDTTDRFLQLENAVKEDKCGRAKNVKKEIEFAFSRKNYCGVITEAIKAGKIPLRVTHNDTKLNNLLFTPDGKTALAVIDLDTVMPGSALFDFGDMCRFGCNSALEDETDLNKVYFKKDFFKSFAKGYMSILGRELTEAEKLNLPFSAILMTFECGMRFLTDYLSGDTYFKISRENHNLDRCRTQFKLVADMEREIEELNVFVKSL